MYKNLFQLTFEYLMVRTRKAYRNPQNMKVLYTNRYNRRLLSLYRFFYSFEKKLSRDYIFSLLSPAHLTGKRRHRKTLLQRFLNMSNNLLARLIKK